MAVDPEVLGDVLGRLRPEVPGIQLDRWAPSVQGAVGQVVGVRDGNGSPYVLKVYPATARRRLDTEVLAQRLLGEVPGVVGPRPVGYGQLGPSAVGFLLMTRLDGVRWADRRADLDPARTTALTREVGRALRQLHRVSGRQFGDLLDDGPRRPTAWEHVVARTGELTARYLRTGGPSRLADRIRRFVEDHRQTVAACPGPVLCHNDFVDSNLLVPATGEPRLCGVVDLERASWNDPLSDLAQTRLHVRYHRPADTTALTEGYGVDGPGEHQRLDVHEVLHALAERNWIAYDRPAGWRESVAALDALLAEST
ncbi:phosphotransferase family protein [Micromonospora inyonensis]|uniref:Predicted kinase, aminoglycoside phosphotransferase (APT) family n=1 Tax=Micromonospora inyonensis TaxID=47866 RepID=A0A1C6S8Q8_9ACTN|nr:aminoglycoside phosphotransferase family protein [Micromonospora inyonensis]SCL25805.1 Predicted kinase, aminoglycoside phosphotransferase (APT) family [Micromonospora inyonensis]